VEKGKIETVTFPEMYKRWPIEMKYNQLKQNLELEDFRGGLVGNIKQDFYAMMMAANMLTSILMEVNKKTG
jgi:hypothetical protein